MKIWQSITEYLARKRNERITLMIIPHDEAKIINIQLSKLFIVFTVVVLFSIVAASYVAWLQEYSIRSEVKDLHSADQAVIEKRDMFLSRYYDFHNVHKSFEGNLIQFIRSQNLASINEIFSTNLVYAEKTAEMQLEEESQELIISLAQENLASLNEASLANNSSQLSNILLRDYRENKSIEGIDKNFRYSREVVAYRSLAIELKQTAEMITALSNLFAVRGKVQRNLPVSWPTQGGHFTSYFGPRYHPLTKRTEFHFGLDIANTRGTPIYAAGDGRVISSNFSSGGYGNRIMIIHRFGYSSVYAHLQSIAVSSGQYVKKGQFIGRMGSTGRSTGPHLHFEVRLNGKHLNPLPFISNI